jgi:hypothetical protein
MATNDLQLRDDLDMIVQGLYIGDINSTSNLQRLKALVRVVLLLTMNLGDNPNLDLLVPTT